MLNHSSNLTRIRSAQSGEPNPEPRVAVSCTEPREASHPQPRAGEGAVSSPERHTGQQPRQAASNREPRAANRQEKERQLAPKSIPQSTFFVQCGVILYS